MRLLLLCDCLSVCVRCLSKCKLRVVTDKLMFSWQMLQGLPAPYIYLRRIVQWIYGVFGRDITKYTFMYGVYTYGFGNPTGAAFTSWNHAGSTNAMTVTLADLCAVRAQCTHTHTHTRTQTHTHTHTNAHTHTHADTHRITSQSYMYTCLFSPPLQPTPLFKPKKNSSALLICLVLSWDSNVPSPFLKEKRKSPVPHNK